MFKEEVPEVPVTLRVAELMGKHRMSQKTLVELTGIRPNTISSYWHSNVKHMDMENIGKLCKALQCSPGDLFEYIPDEEE